MIRRLIALFGQTHVDRRKTHFAFVIAVLLAMIAGAGSRAFAQSQSGFTYNGIVYTSYQASEYQQTPQGSQSTAALRATGTNYAAVVVTQYVQTSTSNTIAPETPSTPGYNPTADPLTPTDAAVVAAIQNLQAQGLTVFLKPHVDSLDGVFRGSFAPTNVAAWFASYQTFILHYAQIASQNNVGGLVIGTELKSLTGSAYAAYWDGIIAQIRSSYPSLTLAYGANATSSNDEFTTVSFWSKVDIIGVDGYFPLTNHADPTVAQLVAAWTNNKNGLNIVSALKTLQNTYNKPLIFTELGYVSASGTNEAPFTSVGPPATYDPTEQANCYEAFFEVFSTETAWMKGVFWWDWNVSPPSSNDTGYASQNKTAATVTLPKWFGSTTPGFSLAPYNSTLALGEGLNAPVTIAVTNQGGFTGAVTLAATGLPTGVSVAFAAGTVAGTQVMTLTATNGATTGTVPVTITGTSGALTATTTVALTVEASGAQSITFNDPGPQTVGVPLTLSATTSAGLAVTFASNTTSVCTVVNTTASFIAAGSCTITASQAGNAIYAAATPVSQTFNVIMVPAVPVPAADDVIVSQVNWLHALTGFVQTSDNPTGGSFGVNANGLIAVADTSSLFLINNQTGVTTTLGAWGGASAVAIDSKNNIYVGSLYGTVEAVVKLPYVGGTSNGGYAAFTTPTASTPACTTTSTTECTVTHAGAIFPSALAFDSAGDLFWITSSNGSTGGNSIFECTVACLGGTGSPVQLYQEPKATTTPSTSSGQLVAGGLAIDPSGNIFFTDSSTYVNVATFAYTSFLSNLNELPTSKGLGFGGATTGYAGAPSVLYTLTPSSIGAYNNQLDGVAVNATNGTVYFADQSDGTFAFPNSGSTIPIANGQPTAMYAVSTQGAKTLTLDAQGNLYLAASTAAITSTGADTLALVGIDSVTVPSSATGTAVSPSATLSPVTTLVNDGGCSSTPVASVTFAAGSSATATATASTTSGCSSTLNGGAAFATTVSFTPTAGGTDSISLTATDQANNTGTVTVSGIGIAPPTPQTITFNNPGAQTIGTPLTLTATATSGLAVTFTSATTSVCTVASATATFLTAGTCTINANQAGNTSFAAAPQVQQSFTVNVAPSFTLAPTASTLSVTQGSTASDTLTVTGANGFTGSVTLAATGLPSGVTASFATNPTTGSSGVTFTASSTATTGAATVTITGTSGSLTSSTTIALTVNLPPSFTLAPTASTLSVTQGSSASDTVTFTGANGFTGNVTLAATGLPNGVTANFATNPTSGSSGVTFTASSTATTGAATVTITGTSGSLTASTTIALTVNLPPSFTLAPTASTLSVAQGSSANDTVTVTGANGFTGSVTLAATGLPSGVTASFATNPATGSSGITFTASSTATTGPATVTITGTSGSLTSSTTIALTVNLPPSFTLAPTAATLSVAQGSSANDTITVTPATGFTGSVTLAATGLPSGVTASFATNPTTGSSGVTFTASSTATTGAATVTITGTSGNLTSSTTIALTVSLPPGFTLAPTAPTVSVAQGNSASDTITVTPATGFTGSVTLAASGLPSGVTASFATNPTTGSSGVTFTASSTATTGVATVSITGTSGNLTASTTITLTVNLPPSFTLAPTASTVSVTQSGSASDTINVTGANGFTGSVTLAASGLPSGVTASFATNPTTGSSGVTFTASGTATTGLAMVTITGTSGSLTASTSIALTVNLAPGFTLAPTASTLSVTQGASATDTVTVTGAPGFTGSVTLAASGLPSGVTAAFATNPTTGTSVVTLTASSTATTGVATVTITGTAGSVTASTTIALTVNAAPSIVLAPNAPTVSVTQGGTTTDVITISGSGGFAGSVSLTAAITSSPAGAQNLPGLSFGSTSPVNVTSSGGGTAILTITTTAATTGEVTYPAHGGAHVELAGGAVLGCLLLLGIPAKRRKWPVMLGMLALLFTFTSAMVGCGGSSTPTASGNSGTTRGNYVVTVTATSGTTTAALPMTITVQ